MSISMAMLYLQLLELKADLERRGKVDMELFFWRWSSTAPQHLQLPADASRH
jgi:hypothetical protein